MVAESVLEYLRKDGWSISITALRGPIGYSIRITKPGEQRVYGNGESLADAVREVEGKIR